MKSRLLACGLLLIILFTAACGSNRLGAELSEDQLMEVTSPPGMTILKDFDLGLVKQTRTINLVSVNGVKPGGYQSKISNWVDVAEAWGRLPDQGVSTDLTVEAAKSSNPVTFTTSAQNMSNRYFIFTDEAKVLGVMNGGSASDASGMAGTYYDSRYTVTILNTEVPDGAPSDYTLKAAAVEACQTSIAVHPTDDAVQRAIANALTGGSSFTTAEMAPRVERIAQETICNSFGLAAVTRSHGASYADYKVSIDGVTVKMPGSPRAIVVPENVYNAL